MGTRKSYTRGLIGRIAAFVLLVGLLLAPFATAAEAAGKFSVGYQSHCQSYGWGKYRWNGATSGTTGKGKRMEALKIKLTNKPTSGSIQYRAHVQGIGWQGWKKEGQLAGTTKQSRRIEAVQIKLTGNLAKRYDVYYRVHAQSYGWMGWTKNGASAGSTGMSKRVEAIQIKLVRKGGNAPGSTNRPFVKQSGYWKYKTVVDKPAWDETVYMYDRIMSFGTLDGAEQGSVDNNPYTMLRGISREEALKPRYLSRKRANFMQCVKPLYTSENDWYECVWYAEGGVFTDGYFAYESEDFDAHWDWLHANVYGNKERENAYKEKYGGLGGSWGSTLVWETVIHHAPITHQEKVWVKS